MVRDAWKRSVSFQRLFRSQGNCRGGNALDYGEPSRYVHEVVGFRSLTEEVDERVAVDGTVPDWLDGTLLRNGPGSFETAAGELDHWFDGLAMVRGFEFDGSAVRLRTQFLDTNTYERAQAGSFTGFASGGAGLFARLKSMLLDPPYDNTNIIVERVGDKLVALTETPQWVQIDGETLDTLGHIDRESVGDIACAHVHHDPWTDEVLTFETQFGRTNQYHCFAYDTPTDCSTVATVPVDEPSYMHSFAATRNYLILTEFPFVVNPLEFLKPGKRSFVEAFRWEPDRGLRLQVINRNSGEVVATPTTTARFGFHHVNAYEPDDENEPTIVFDIETVPDADSLAALSLSRLRSGEYNTPMGRLRRYEVDRDADAPGGAVVDSRRLHGRGTGLPVVSPAVRMRKHRYVYGQGGALEATGWPRSLVKVDTVTETATTYDAGGLVNEPLFVPAPQPGRASEDDGVVLAVVLDTDRERSRLDIIDARTMERQASAAFSVALPIGFHGRYFGDEN